jgi:hypothetical protein
LLVWGDKWLPADSVSCIESSYRTSRRAREEKTFQTVEKAGKNGGGGLMEDAEKQKKIDVILAAARRQINILTSAKKSGKYELTLELNVSEGGIGDTFLRSQTRERI